MPYRLILPKPLPEYPDLVAALVEELRLERPDGPEDAPFILEEKVRHHDLSYVKVFWDRWEGIAAEDRGRVILDAVCQVRGEPAILKITAALGLTHAEARRLGVDVAQ